MCENQLIPGHRFAEHLKQRCRQNSVLGLLRTPASKKEGPRKTTAIRDGTDSVTAAGDLGTDKHAQDQVVHLS